MKANEKFFELLQVHSFFSLSISSSLLHDLIFFYAKEVIIKREKECFELFVSFLAWGKDEKVLEEILLKEDVLNVWQEVYCYLLIKIDANSTIE